MRATRSRVLLSVALAALLAMHGCSNIGGERQRLASIGTLLGPGAQLSDAQLRLELMRFADGFSTGLYEASELLKASTEVVHGRFTAQKLLVHAYWNVVEIAAGQDPEINLLDMMVNTMLLRLLLEDYWIPERLAGAGSLLLEEAQRGEREVWGIGAIVLDEESLAGVRAMAQSWLEENPDRTLVFGVRFADFTSELDAGDRQRAVAIVAEVQAATSAAREVEIAAERILFTLQHIPFLLRMQVNLAYYELVREAEIQKLLEDFGAVTQTFSTWPENLAAERSAAIDQALAGIAAEREALLANLEDQRPMLAELRETLDAGAALVDASDALAERLRVGQPGRGPFDIAPYSEAAVEVTRASEEIARTLAALQALLESEGASTTLPELATAADRLLVRAFWWLLGLVATSAAVIVAASLVHRALAQRLSRSV